MQNDIRIRQVLSLVLGNHDGYGPLSNAQWRVQRLRVHRACVQVNSNHNIRPHGACHVDRQVVDRAAIRVDMAIHLYWREHRRDGHGRAERQCDGSAVEDVRFAGRNIGGDASKRDRKIVEALQVVVRQQCLRKEERYRRPRIQPARDAEAVPQSKLQAVWISLAIFLTPE